MLIVEPVSPATHGAVNMQFLKSLTPLENAVTALPGFQDLCLRAGDAAAGPSSCLVYSPLAALAAATNSTNPQSHLLDILSRVSFTTQGPAPYEVPTKLLLGAPQRNASSGSLLGAQAVQMLFIMSPSASPDALEEFEARFIALGRAASDGARRVFVQAPRSYQDESDRIIAEDSPLVGAAIALMFVYVSVVLGGRPPVRSQVALGLTVVGTVGAAMLVSAAWACM